MKLDPKWIVLAFVVAMVCTAGLILAGKMPVEMFIGVLTTLLGWLAVPPRVPNPPPSAPLLASPDETQPVTVREGKAP